MNLIVLILHLFLLGLASCQLCHKSGENILNLQPCNSKQNMTVMLRCYNTRSGWLCPDKVILREKQEMFHNGSSYYCVGHSRTDTECNSHCLGHENLELTCSGDSSYCSTHNCTPVADCDCRSAGFQSIQQVKSNEWLNISESRLIRVGAYPMMFMGVKKSIRGLRSLTETPLVSLQRFTLYVFSSGFNGSILVSKSIWRQSFLIYESLSTELPRELFLTSGVMSVQFFQNGQMQFSTELPMTGQIICVNSDCFFCKEVFDNWSCLHSAQKLMLVLTYILIFFLLIGLFPIVFYSLFWTIKLLLWPIKFMLNLGKRILKSRFLKDMKTKGLEVYKKKDYFLAQEEESEDLVAELPSRVKSKQSRTIMAFALLGIMSFAAGQCSNGVFITGSNMQCSRNVSSTNCAMTFQTFLTSQQIGSTTCFTAVDNLNNTQFTGQIQYVSAYDKIALGWEYWTFRYIGRSASQQRCNGAGPCPQSCPSTFPNDKTAANQIQQGPVTQSQGQSFCRSACGCAWCGCFLCSSSCVYSRYSLNRYSNWPVDMAVYSISAVSRIPTVSFKVWDNNNLLVQESVFSVSGESVQVGPFVIELIGSLDQNIQQYYSDKKILYHLQRGDWYIGSASDLNAPIAGSVGEIQALDYNSATQCCPGTGPEVSNFKFSSGLVSRVTSDTSDDFLFSPSYLRVVDGDTSYKLVNNVGQLFFSATDNVVNPVSGSSWMPVLVALDSSQRPLYYINASVSNASPLLLNFGSYVGYNFTLTQDIVCPNAGFSNASGCYQCLLGSVVVIEANSVCRPGLATVLVSDAAISLFTTSVFLDTNKQHLLIYFQTTKASNQFTIVLKANGGNETIDVFFVAIPGSNLTANENLTSYLNNNFIPADGNFLDDFFKSLFNGSASWSSWLFFIIFVVVSLILLSVLIPMLIRTIFTAAKSIKNKLAFKGKSKAI